MNYLGVLAEMKSDNIEFVEDPFYGGLIRVYHLVRVYHLARYDCTWYECTICTTRTVVNSALCPNQPELEREFWHLSLRTTTDIYLQCIARFVEAGARQTRRIIIEL